MNFVSGEKRTINNFYQKLVKNLSSVDFVSKRANVNLFSHYVQNFNP